MKEQILKMLIEMDEKEIKELVDCINQCMFEGGLDYSTERLKEFTDFCWKFAYAE